MMFFIIFECFASTIDNRGVCSDPLTKKINSQNVIIDIEFLLSPKDDFSFKIVNLSTGQVETVIDSRHKLRKYNKQVSINRDLYKTGECKLNIEINGEIQSQLVKLDESSEFDVSFAADLNDNNICKIRVEIPREIKNNLKSTLNTSDKSSPYRHNSLSNYEDSSENIGETNEPFSPASNRRTDN